jgi:hypothetical protein
VFAFMSCYDQRCVRVVFFTGEKPLSVSKSAVHKRFYFMGVVPHI